MNQEEKDLLFIDLCERIPYGVIFHYTNKFVDTEVGDGELRSIYINDCLTTDFSGIVINQTETGLGYIKPYLRPMLSMTDEEREEYRKFSYYGAVGVRPYTHGDFVAVPSFEKMDWLNANHFDYRGLIEKKLAIEVTKDNNPYDKQS